MKIEYEASILQQVLNLHKLEPISSVHCTEEEYFELAELSKQSGLGVTASDDWFNITDYGITVYLRDG